MEQVKILYGDKYRELQTAVWEKGFKGGHAGAEHGLSDEAVAWLDKAIESYHSSRFKKLFIKIDQESDSTLIKQRELLLDDICGKNRHSRKQVFDAVLNDPRSTQKTKDWLLNNARNK